LAVSIRPVRSAIWPGDRCVLPDWALLEFNNRPELYTLRIGEKGLHSHLYLATRKQDSDAPWMRGFIELAREQVRELSDQAG